MLPTFFGLDTVTRALLAQQEAVDVVNQNISNASTPGYSRQQAVVTATDPYTAVAFNRPALPGQLGTGATVSKINRFVDELLNTQIRDQSQASGQLQSMDDFYTQIQSIFNDPSDIAVNSAAINFYNAVHDVSNNPESIPAREALQQQGVTLANAITNRYNQLTSLQQDLNVKVQTIVADINTTTSQIATLNTQIAQVTGVGDNANDLMDQRDLLVDHLSSLVDTHDVKNPDGTDTIQLNGRFLVNKDQAYALTTLTDASSPSLVKPVKVFWQEDVTKFQNMHPGYDPITGVNLTTGASLPSTANPPLSVSPANITTGSLYGTMAIRDQVIQDTLIPQLNQLADGLTNTQVLSPKGGLNANATPSGGTGSFVISVLTPKGKTLTFNPSISSTPPTTVQGVIDAINGSVVSPYVHASLNAAGELQIDTIQTGALVKVDQADAVASRLFGFSQSVADGFNLVHVQGFGLDTPPQWTGGISGLTLGTPIGTGDGVTITGPDGVPVTVVVQPPLSDPQVVAPTAVGGPFTVLGQPSAPQNLAVAINGATASGTVTINGTDVNGNALSETLNFNGNGTLTTVNKFASISTVGGISTTGLTGGTLSVTGLATPNTVSDLINAINSVSLTDTQAIGKATGLTPLTTVTNASYASFMISVVRPDGQTVTFNPSAALTGAGPFTVQNVIDAINGTGNYAPNTVSGFVRAFINPSGNLEIDSTTPGALLKVDQASGNANTLFGFQTTTQPSPVGQQHGFQASLDTQGHLIIASQPTIYGPSGQLQSISAQIVGNQGGLTTGTTFGGAGTMTIVGPNGQYSASIAGGSTVGALITAINTANIGVTASINSAGQFQLTTQQVGPNATITITGSSGSVNTQLGLADGGMVGQRRGYPPSASVTASTLPGTVAAGSADFFGTPSSPIPTPNQFFFQGAAQVLQTQVVPSMATASVSAQFPKSLSSPGQLAFTLVGASGFGTITVNGTDVNGNPLTDTLTFTANGTLKTSTSNMYKTISSVSVGTITGGNLAVTDLVPSTQYDTAATLNLDGNILKDPSLIAASSTPEAPGNDTNALALLNVQQNATISAGQQAATLGDFYSSVITDLGDAAQQTHTSLVTQQQLVQHLTNQKQSIVGVSIDQEASNLVALQHAYMAAARAITTQDSMLDTIINNMGLVGRA